ncbi:helix-turn-helix transcriptional regulator [Streptomyces sp. ISL-44]|uniref:helix-turn-helix domain-containing protein n=1 Tax=Streptomyces sp. ISL-44 TaxID=2819184 RepID=UPI001BEA7AF7|nr:helix-turn-helix transcriptional regulator [Streptomyces sp. ISL-44]MBT2545717.1 helix-turn-helix transcriptional regulator [Streptomyces sp. ISL-44]
MTSAGSQFPHPAAAGVQWRLRMAAAERGVWTGTQLRRLLAEKAQLDLSPASVSALFTKQPSQVKLYTLAALCTALDCAPGDLLVLSPAVPAPASVPVAAGLSGGQSSPGPLRAAGRRSLPPL